MLASFEHVYESGALVMESGQLALQANGSILVKQGDCALLVTATMSKPREGIDFFPLTIDVEERLYSRGKIPGSFFRREGRPSTHGILMARLTDRQLRPLFPVRLPQRSPDRRHSTVTRHGDALRDHGDDCGIGGAQHIGYTIPGPHRGNAHRLH